VGLVTHRTGLTNNPPLLCLIKMKVLNLYAGLVRIEDKQQTKLEVSK